MLAGMDLHLYPTPRSVQTVAGTAAVPAQLTVSGAPTGMLATISGLSAREDAAGWIRLALGEPREAGPEAYRLTVAADGVRILARTATGLCWGLATLGQLLRASPGSLPCLVIEDAPAFTERGFMLDIARDRVPTMATLFDLVDRMSSLKLNHLQLYNEHAFAYVGHEVVWRAADPVTPAEMKQLDAYAAARGVVLTANQNSFGHFERWLRHPKYAPLGEIAGPWLFPAWGHVWMEPNTLCPLDPGSITLVEDLFRQLFPCCSGPYANIGGDEPIDLGQGRSKDACAAKGNGRVFSEYLGQVLRAAQRAGKRPQFWCDPHPNEDDSLPKDLTVLVWGYGKEEDFATRLATHGAAGRELWVAPGTNNWGSYTSRTDVRRGNLSRAASQGAAAKAVGYLNTEWGDNGHRQQWPLALFGMADGAQAAWSGGGTFDDAAAGLHVFGSAALGPWLAELGRVDQVFPGYASASFNDGNVAWSNDADPALVPRWKSVAAEFARLDASLPAVGGLVEQECRLAIATARYVADRAVARREGAAIETRRAFQTRLSPLCTEYRRLWLARSRYGGLEDSYVKLKALAG